MTLTEWLLGLLGIHLGPTPGASIGTLQQHIDASEREQRRMQHIIGRTHNPVEDLLTGAGIEEAERRWVPKHEEHHRRQQR